MRIHMEVIYSFINLEAFKVLSAFVFSNSEVGGSKFRGFAFSNIRYKGKAEGTTVQREQPWRWGQ